MCYPAGSDNDCVGDDWMPANDTDWQDYYHGEFRGFAELDSISPAGDLTVQHYAATDGWFTPQSNAHNYTSGALGDEELYQGSSASGPLLAETQNVYAGYDTLSGSGTTANSCNGLYSGLYPPCEVMVITSRTTQYEGTSPTNASAPWVEQDSTYDDYTPSTGLVTGYHNPQTIVISSSNAATITQQLGWKVTDSTNGSWVYYSIHNLAHSEIDDSAGHVWACQDITYDEGVGSGVPQPDAGWPTTVKTYSNCANQGSSAVTTHTGYDVNGDPLVTVDGLATANPAFYGGGGIQGKNGCAAPGGLQIVSSAWTAGTYTTCTAYDGTSSLPTSLTNAFGQATTITYDATQGDVPVSTKDANSQVTSYSYSYPTGDPTVQTIEPNPGNSYTTQTQSISHCTTSSTLPCYESDSQSASYPGAVSRTFSDALGRAVETITPVPTPAGGSGSSQYEQVQYTVYNDSAHSTFQSQPFTVLAGSSWVDPNGATDYLGHSVYGTATFSDAMGRVIAVQDAAFGQSQAAGNPCPPLIINGSEANATDCAIYKLDTVDQISQDGSDTNTYAAVEHIDPDNHAGETYLDALGNTRYVISYGGVVSGQLSPNSQVVSAYTALGEAQSVTTTDLAPLSGETTTSVTVSMAYDDLGRLTQEVDPDRGTHSYTYDPDGNVIDDVSGTRTIGSNVDLLGRVGCLQVGAATSDADGSCTSGTQALVQNTYDTDALGTQGSTDFPVGRLTQSQSFTYYPEGGDTKSTQKYQYDQRGRVVTEQLAFSVPSGWHVTQALPTYQAAFSYNDADQLSTTTTSTINSSQQSTPGYSFYQNYDSTTGVPVGLSTQTSSTPNLAALTSNTFGLTSNLTFQNGSTQLAAEQFSYDGDLRPSSDTAVWQSGSGQSGQFFTETRSFDQESLLVSQATTLAAVNGGGSTGGSETANECYNAQNDLVWASNTQTPHPVGGQSCGNATPGTTFSGGNYTNSFVYTHLGQLWQGPQSGTGANQQYLYCTSSNPHQLTDIVPMNQGYSCSNLPSGTSLPYALAYNSWGDANSRAINGAAATLSYNKLDEMTEWQLPSTSQAWDAYDSSGERTLQRATIGSTTTITVYAFGLEEYSYDGSGNLQSSTHYYSLDGRLIGELQTTGGGVSSTYFYLTDNLGSLLAVFNNVTSNAVLLSTQLYAPYGSSRYAAGPQLSTYTGKGYTGQYSDAVSGLDYYNARYYDPVSGVFLSADTMQGNDQGMNPYAYAGNNPTTNADPSGHAPNDLDPAIVQFFQQLAVNGVALWNLFLSYLSPTPAGTFPPPNVNQATIQQQQTAEGMQVPPAYDNLIEGQLAGQNVQDDNKGNSTSDGEDPNDPSTRTLPRNPGATGNQTAKNQSKNGGKIIRNKSGNGYKQYHYQVLAEEKKLNVEIQYQDALQKAAAYPMGTVVSGGASLGGSWWSQLWERVGSYVQQTSEDFYQSVNNFKIDEGPSTVPETDPGGVPGPIDPGVDPELPLAPGFTILFAFLFRR